MDGRRKVVGLAVLFTVAGLIAVGTLVGLTVVYTGAYNIAATEEHTSLFRWTFDTTFRNSVRRQAAEISAPKNVSPQMISAGASDYKQMCQQCHSGPGVERAEWASGMRPKPPHLKEAAAGWDIKEIFWLVKHGAKMTGMPAFGPTHDDQALWNIAAFVKELPAMTPERYAALGKAGADGGQSTHGHSEPSNSR